MRFRLGTTGTGQSGADGFARGFQALFSAPMLQAQAAEQAQDMGMKRQLMESQQRQADAHAALYSQQAEAERTKLDRGSLPELVATAALMNKAPLHQVPEIQQFAQTGQLPGQYVQPPEDLGGGPALPKPEYANQQGLGGQIMQTLGLLRGGLTAGGNIDQIAKAGGELQKQDAVRTVAADPASAGRVGQAFAASEGKPLIENVGTTGVGFNRFTGQGGTLDPALRALYGDVQQAGIRKDNASAANSFASAGQHKAQTDKIRLELEQGQRTGDLQVVTGQDGAITVVNKRTLTAQPVLDAQGRPVVKGAAGGGGKALTEGQAKANLFGGRMMEAGAILDDMEKQGVMRPGLMKQAAEGIAGAVPIIGPDLGKGAGAVMNWTQSSNQQSVEQAQRDFINAVLRRESGAAISQGEFDNAFRQYFPQPGDSKQVIEQKRRNRQIATTLMLQEVPEAHRYRMGQGAQQSAPASPQASTGGASGSWDAPAAGGWSIQKVN